MPHPSNPVQMPPGVMSPGTYLRKRREASGLDLPALAFHLVGLPWAIREPTARDVDLLAERLALIEADRFDLTKAQADLVRNVVRFDPAIYQALLLLRQTYSPDAGPDNGLPIPSICRACGCTWFVACVDERGHACSWASVDEDLCTHCVPAHQPEGEPA
jgi:hypothetical protein